MCGEHGFSSQRFKLFAGDAWFDGRIRSGGRVPFAFARRGAVAAKLDYQCGVGLPVFVALRSFRTVGVRTRAFPPVFLETKPGLDFVSPTFRARTKAKEMGHGSIFVAVDTLAGQATGESS